MNPTGTSSPLASLMMSLGGSIDLKSLELTSDGALPLSDFSSVLADYTAGEAEGSGLSAALAGLIDGEALPQLLPSEAESEMSAETTTGFNGLSDSLTLSSASVESTEPVLSGLEHVMAQIEKPVNVSIRYAGEDTSGSGRSNELVPEDWMDVEDSELTDTVMGQPIQSAATEMQQNPSALAQVTASLKSGSQATGIAPQGTRAETLRSSKLDDANLMGLSDGELPVDSEINSDVFRPVTAAGDNDSPFLNRDNPQSAQQPLAQSIQANNSQSQTTTATPTVAAALTTTVEAGSDTASDSFSVAEAADDFQDHRIERQMRDRLEFGQDRREWTPALGARLMTMVADDVQQARIQLDPPELGSLEIKLQISQDQASVQVTAQNHQVKDVLDSGARALRDALAAEGIELSEFSVGTGPDTGAGQSGDGDSGDSFAGDGGDGSQPDDESAQTVALTKRAPDALLDTFA